jgi:hypothetical protein
MSPPDCQQLHESFFQEFWREWDEKIREAAQWGLPTPPEEFERSPSGELILPAGVFRFAQFVNRDCCLHGKRELAKFLRNAGYPKPYLELKIVTEAGYQKALTDRQRARPDTDAERQRNNRKKRKPPKTS